MGCLHPTYHHSYIVVLAFALDNIVTCAASPSSSADIVKPPVVARDVKVARALPLETAFTHHQGTGFLSCGDMTCLKIAILPVTLSSSERYEGRSTGNAGCIARAGLTTWPWGGGMVDRDGRCWGVLWCNNTTWMSDWWGIRGVH